jgi:ribosomal protein S28E/S33
MTPLDSTFKTAAGLALLPARITAAAVGEARELERSARRDLSARADRAMMAAIDITLERLLADDVIDRALTRLEQSGAAQRIADRLFDDGIAEQIVERALAGPEAERILARALEGPLVEEAVSRLLENQAVWVLVDEIARSPAVTEAIAHQGYGFSEQVAERARERSRNADALLERVANRLIKRKGGTPAGPQPTLPESTP